MISQAELAGRTIRFGEDVVIKTQEPRSSRRERLRTQAAYALAEQSDAFVVPRIVSFDDARGEIVFERLRLVAFRQALSESGRGPALVEEAASALAMIHGGLDYEVPDQGPRPDRSALAPGRPQVPLHGDYGLRNLFYVAEADRVAIIDWTTADWIGVEADLGAPEIDLAVFLVSFFHRRMLGPWPIAHRHELARLFLATYAATAPHGVDLAALRAIVDRLAPAFGRMVRRRKGALHALTCRPAMIDFQLFLRRLSRRGLAAVDAAAGALSDPRASGSAADQRG